MIAVVGIGGAGGNIADVATQYGFQAGAINFSERDLSSLEHVENRLKLSGSEGVGKNRELAIELFQKHYEKAVNFIEDNFSSCKIIVLPFATGGGSGSGVSPIFADVLIQTFPDKVFIAMPILPDINESIASQINTLQVFEELSSLNITIMPIDNIKVYQNNSNNGKNEIYRKTNKTAIENLYKVWMYTQNESKNGNFDEKDFLTVINTKGICVIGEIAIKKTNDTLNLSGDIIPQAIHKSWIDSIYTTIETDKIIKAGFIYNGKEEHMKEIELTSIFNKFKSGMPIELFEGYYHDSECTFTTILSGLSFPKTRLQQIEQIIEQNESKFEKIINDDYEYKAKTPNLLNKVRRGKTDTGKQSANTTSIFSKYKR